MNGLVIMQNQQVVTTSLQIAEDFGKQHKNVLRELENLVAQNPAAKNMFSKGEYENRGKQYPMYFINRDGFTLLAMGFTGKEAVSFKIYYIEAFNKMEAALKPSLPGTYKEALLGLIAAEEEKEQLQLENKILDQRVSEMEPKVTYVDEVLKSKDLMVTTQIADDYGMTAHAFNKLLHTHGIQYKINGQWLLYARHKGQGYTKSHTTTYRKQDGSEGTSLLTKWTQKGRLHIYQLLKTKGILPVMEKQQIME